MIFESQLVVLFVGSAENVTFCVNKSVLCFFSFVILLNRHKMWPNSETPVLVVFLLCQLREEKNWYKSGHKNCTIVSKTQPRYLVLWTTIKMVGISFVKAELLWVMQKETFINGNLCFCSFKSAFEEIDGLNFPYCLDIVKVE